jgi:hypothetical protein
MLVVAKTSGYILPFANSCNKRRRPDPDHDSPTNSSFVIRHSSFVIRHSSFVIRHSFVLGYFVLRHSQSG